MDKAIWLLNKHSDWNSSRNLEGFFSHCILLRRKLCHQNSSIIPDVKSILYWILFEFLNSDQKTDGFWLIPAPSFEIFWIYPDLLCLGKAVLVMLITLVNHYYRSNIIYKYAARVGLSTVYTALEWVIMPTFLGLR